MNQAQWEKAIAVIAAGDVWGADDLRGVVEESDYPRLIEQYAQAKSWAQKDVVAALLANRRHASLKALFLDYMQVQITEESQIFTLAQMLAYFGEEYDQFKRYFTNYDLLIETLNEVLAKYGLTRPPEEEQSEPEEKIEKKVTPLTDIAIAARLPEDTSPEEQLLVAIERADITLLNQAIAQGADFDTRIQHPPLTGCTPLMAAIQSQHGDLALRLIEAGADVNTRRSDKTTVNPEQGQTALSWAMTQPQMQIVDALIAAGADVDCPNTYGSTPLHTAITYDNTAYVDKLLAAGVDFSHPRYEQRRPLSHAIKNGGDMAMIRHLLALGDDVNARFQIGYTPLILAVEEGYLDVVKLLLAHGADPNAVHLGGGPSTMPGGYERWRGMTPLAFAIERGAVQMVRTLLAGGANPNQAVEKPDGTTVELMALEKKKKAAIAELLAQSA